MLTRDADMEPKIIVRTDIEPSNEVIQSVHKQASNPEVSNPEIDTTPISENSETKQTDKGKIITKEMVDADWNAQWSSIGLKPPPDGYYYSWSDGGSPRLMKYNTPNIRLNYGESRYGQLYQLTDDEYEEYKALNTIVLQPQANDALIADGWDPRQLVIYPDEVIGLAKEWYEDLHQKTYGPSISVISSTTYNREMTQEDIDKEEQMSDDLLASVKLERDKSMNSAVREQLLDEMEKVLGIEIHRVNELTRLYDPSYSKR